MTCSYGGEIGHQMCFPTTDSYVVLWCRWGRPISPEGVSWVDRKYRWAQREENLVRISIKLALILSPMTVSDTEPISAVIKAAPRWDGFHYRARWLIYLDSDCILQIALFLKLCWSRRAKSLNSAGGLGLPATRDCMSRYKGVHARVFQMCV